MRIILTNNSDDIIKAKLFGSSKNRTQNNYGNDERLKIESSPSLPEYVSIISSTEHKGKWLKLQNHYPTDNRQIQINRCGNVGDTRTETVSTDKFYIDGNAELLLDINLKEIFILDLQ